MSYDLRTWKNEIAEFIASDQTEIAFGSQQQ